MSPSVRPAAAALLFGLALAVSATSAQPPEVEDVKPKVKKIVVDEPDAPAPKAAPAGNPAVRLDELAAAAKASGNPAIKAALERFTVPFDKLTVSGGIALRTVPLKLHRSDKYPAEFGVQELSPDGIPGQPKNMTPREVKRIDHFEDLALAEAEGWLKKDGGKDTAPEFLAAAERLLAAALRYHDYAVANNLRIGKAWAEVRKPLAEKLREARLRELRAAAAAGDAAKVRDAAAKLRAAYPTDQAVLREAAEAQLGEAERLLKTKQFAEQVRAREMLDDFELRHPGAGGDVLKRTRKELTDEAHRFLVLARADKSAGNEVRARDYARQAEALDPNLPGLRELSRDLGTGSTVMAVGARVFPERLSPVTARFDSEKQVVELLFEGLLDEIPDPAGGTRYRPGAALGLPRVVPGGREVDVRTFAPGGPTDPGFDAADVAETVKLYRTRPELWTGYPLPWLEDVPTPTGPGSVRVAFRHGHPDPRALLTFKLLPARWMAEKGKRVDDADFSTKPVGTGPFKYNSVATDPKTGARTLTLVDNPHYAKSRDRAGLPHLREVRFVELGKGADTFDEFRHGRLHVVPDLTPGEVARALSRNGAELGGQGQLYTAATNRRVYVLALNHRKTPFQSRDLRRGLGLAIDREAILLDVMAGVPAAHRRTTAAMSGPYPPGSWAAPRGPGGHPPPLLDRNDAIARFGRYLSNAAAPRELKLAYPADDPTAKAACEQIKAQVESLFKNAPAENRLKLDLDPRAPRDFLRHVESEQRFDLAYVPFDYPDDWHPLGLAAYLDPDAAGRDGRNVTGYLAPETNPEADDRILGGELEAFRMHRDYAGDLAPRAHRVHTLFNDRMPFVPLWQLDRHFLLSAKVKVVLGDGTDVVQPYLLNPTGLFQNAARWRME